MIAHLHDSPRKPARAVVLGAGGFIGAAATRRLQSEGIDVAALGRDSCDLLASDAATRLAAKLRPDDTLVFVSAHAPCKNVTMLMENMRMGEAVCLALKNQPVAHVVYVSSDAVYKDSTEPLSESSCAEPGSLHGVMHLTREVMLRSEFSGPLVCVRPTLTYGIDDPHNGYGPNRFRRLAAEGKDLVLFGEGEEQRDHVAVDDIAELVLRLVIHRSTGIVNAVTGEVVSFRALAEFITAQFTPPVAIKGSPRIGQMPHNGLRPFAPSAALAAFPGFKLTPWREGIARMCAETRPAEER
jgi:nucleoside-diphosphate-sugar epimerase